MSLEKITKCPKGCKPKPQKMENSNRMICPKCGWSWYPYRDFEEMMIRMMPGSELI